MAVFGTISIFVRNIPLPSAELALCRAVIAAATLLIWQILTRTMVRFQDIKRAAPVCFSQGRPWGVNWILFSRLTIHQRGVSHPELLFCTGAGHGGKSPAVSGTAHRTADVLLSIVMSTLGLVLVIGVSGGAGSGGHGGVLFGLGAAVFYAAVVLCNKGIRNVTGINRTYLQFLSVHRGAASLRALHRGFHLAELPAKGLASSGGGRHIYTGIVHFHFSSLRYSEGAGGGDLKLHRPAGGRAGVGDRAGGVRHLAAGGRRSHDSGLHHPE